MDVDTSSYPRAAPVQQQNPLDTIGKLQGIQRQQIGISKDKFDLMNQQYGVVKKYFATLLNDPNVKAEDVVNRAQDLFKLGIIPSAEAYAQHVSMIPSMNATQRKHPEIKDPNQLQDIYREESLKPWLQQGALQAEDNHNAMGWMYGQQTNDAANGQTTQAQRYLPLQGRVIPAGPPVQQQNPPGSPAFGGQTIGPQPTQLPTGSRPVPGGVAGAFQPGGNAPVPVSQRPLKPPALPVRPGEPPVGQPGTASERVAQGFNSLQPRGPGVAPGVASAMEATGHASGEMLARDRDQATNYQRSIFPLEKSIDALEKLGTSGTGPGTDTFNNLKSFLVSWAPEGLKPDIEKVKNYDEAKKYLTDFVNQNGNTGTNDKLAAAFAGNPSVHISNAAAKDVAKSALALSRMKMAQVQAFDRLNLPDSEYGKWASQHASQWDARAFGVDKMSKEAKAKLRAQLEKNPNEKANFEQSLAAAHNLGLIRLSQ